MSQVTRRGRAIGFSLLLALAAISFTVASASAAKKPHPTPTQTDQNYPPDVIVVTPVVVPTPGDEGQQNPTARPSATLGPPRSPIPATETSPSHFPIGAGAESLPSPQPGFASAGIIEPPGGGMPWQFIVLGTLFTAAALASLVYSFAPASRGSGRRRLRSLVQPKSPVVFTPYGASTERDAPGLTRRPRRRPRR